MKKNIFNLSASLLGGAAMVSAMFSCQGQKQESHMKAKVEEYASVELKSELVNGLSDNEKELLRIFFQIGKITDDLFWKQTFGDKSILDTITDSYAKQFAMIQYGVWAGRGGRRDHGRGQVRAVRGAQGVPGRPLRAEPDREGRDHDPEGPEAQGRAVPRPAMQMIKVPFLLRRQEQAV